MADAPNILVATIDKNRGSSVRVNLTEFRGQRLVDVRLYVDAGATKTPMPTKRGIALRVEALPDLYEAIGDALAMARDKGLIGAAA